MGTKKFRIKVAKCRKKRKVGRFSLVRFCILRLKGKKRKGGAFPITLMRFPGNRLVEQIEQKLLTSSQNLEEKQKEKT